MTITLLYAWNGNKERGTLYETVVLQIGEIPVLKTVETNPFFFLIYDFISYIKEFSILLSKELISSFPL